MSCDPHMNCRRFVSPPLPPSFRFSPSQEDDFSSFFCSIFYAHFSLVRARGLNFKISPQPSSLPWHTPSHFFSPSCWPQESPFLPKSADLVFFDSCRLPPSPPPVDVKFFLCFRLPPLRRRAPPLPFFSREGRVISSLFFF